MKLSEVVVGTEYAVVPSWTYSGRGARDVATVRENDVVKATLVDKGRYEYEPSIRKTNPHEFRLAAKDNRSIGVIVKATDRSGDEIFWTSRLHDIVAPYAELEPRWSQAKAEEEKREEEARKARQRAEEIQKAERNRVSTARNSVIATSKELLGEKCEVTVDTTGYGVDTKAIVTMSLTDYERLVEYAYQVKELSA